VCSVSTVNIDYTVNNLYDHQLQTYFVDDCNLGRTKPAKTVKNLRMPLASHLDVTANTHTNTYHHLVLSSVSRDVTKFEFEHWQILNSFTAFDIRRMLNVKIA